MFPTKIFKWPIIIKYNDGAFISAIEKKTN